jgi:hypothetical protein
MSGNSSGLFSASALRWPCALDGGDEIVARHALDRLLARRIDIGDDHHVGVVEAGGEFIEQRLQPRVAMRLHHGDDLPPGGGARGAQHGGDLDRMMAVIVEDGRAVPVAGAGEAPFDAAESRPAPCRITSSGFMPSSSATRSPPSR